jgi:hypothetical protein
MVNFAPPCESGTSGRVLEARRVPEPETRPDFSNDDSNRDSVKLQLSVDDGPMTKKLLSDWMKGWREGLFCEERARAAELRAHRR